MSTAIEFNNISKQYRLGLVSTKTLSHDLNRWWNMHVLGIIGRNGVGKFMGWLAYSFCFTVLIMALGVPEPNVNLV